MVSKWSKIGHKRSQNGLTSNDRNQFGRLPCWLKYGPPGHVSFLLRNEVSYTMLLLRPAPSRKRWRILAHFTRADKRIADAVHTDHVFIGEGENHCCQSIPCIEKDTQLQCYPLLSKTRKTTDKKQRSISHKKKWWQCCWHPPSSTIDCMILR